MPKTASQAMLIDLNDLSTTPFGSFTSSTELFL